MAAPRLAAIPKTPLESATWQGSFYNADATDDTMHQVRLPARLMP